MVTALLHKLKKATVSTSMASGYKRLSKRVRNSIIS